tara:strand:+ start:1876 stop:2733 length:858 start_codon:yes stop_codon:yes gene_type:complete
MMGAPWKVFFKDDKNIIIDVDGNIDVDGHVARPFPCSITNAEICSSGLIATWVDHDLRLARMAMLDIDESIKDGITKSDLRLMRNTSDVAGSKWSHAIDAEPLCMSVGENKIFFALWSRGIYCIDFEATEKWRIPLFENPDKSPPRAKEITAISVLDDYAIVWSRDGTFKKINSESGDLELEGSIEVECDLESVFNYGEKFLLSSKDGWVWEYENQQITVARKLRGTIQDAIFDGEDWRIICWRDDIMLRGESSRRAELGVQIIMNNGAWSVMDNQGQISPHMKE